MVMAGVCVTQNKSKFTLPNLRTPRLYKEAGKIVEAFENQQGGLKSLVYNAKHVAKLRLNALVCQVVKHRSVLGHVISVAQLDKEHVNPYLLRVLVYEGLFNKKQLTGNGKTVCCARNHLKALENALSKYLEAKNVKTVSEISEASSNLPKLPRYARINTLKTTMSSVFDVLQYDGYVKIDYECGILYEKFVELVKNLQPEEFLCDLHIDNLLIFHSEANFFYHDLYRSGKLLLQDKSSCFPVLLLKPLSGSYILDACAAPGMKTTHLAAAINNEGVILAQDQNSERLNVMKEILQLANVTCATIKLIDFTSVNPNTMPYKRVKFILVDPSCSGSGIVKRSMWDENSSAASQERLTNLSKFQLELLLKALSFPNVERVAYSTCSVHSEENEGVIRRALKKFSYKFKLLQLPSEWPYVTNDMSTASKHWYGTRCLRTLPERDLMNGFFVAVFERKYLVDKRVNGDDSADCIQSEPTGQYKKNPVKGTSDECYTDIASHVSPAPQKQKKKGKSEVLNNDSVKLESEKHRGTQNEDTEMSANDKPNKKMKRKRENYIEEEVSKSELLKQSRVGSFDAERAEISPTHRKAKKSKHKKLCEEENFDEGIETEVIQKVEKSKIRERKDDNFNNKSTEKLVTHKKIKKTKIKDRCEGKNFEDADNETEVAQKAKKSNVRRDCEDKSFEAESAETKPTHRKAKKPKHKKVFEEENFEDEGIETEVAQKVKRSRIREQKDKNCNGESAKKITVHKKLKSKIKEKYKERNSEDADNETKVTHKAKKSNFRRECKEENFDDKNPEKTKKSKIKGDGTERNFEDESIETEMVQKVKLSKISKGCKVNEFDDESTKMLDHRKLKKSKITDRCEGLNSENADNDTEAAQKAKKSNVKQEFKYESFVAECAEMKPTHRKDKKSKHKKVCEEEKFDDESTEKMLDHKQLKKSKIRVECQGQNSEDIATEVAQLIKLSKIRECTEDNFDNESTKKKAGHKKLKRSRNEGICTEGILKMKVLR